MSNGNDPYASIGARIVGGGTIRGGQYDTAQKKAQADLEKQRIEIERQAEELRRLRATPEPKPPKSTAQMVREETQTAQAKELGSMAGKAQSGLPGAEQSAYEARLLLRQLLGHEGFSAAVGMPNPFKGGLGFTNVRGTPAAGFQAMLDQAKGGAFLQAIEKMKGSGAISKEEGEAATNAITRLKTGLSEADFRAAAADFDRVVAGGLDAARQKARMGAIPYSYEQLKAEQERRAARKR